MWPLLIPALITGAASLASGLIKGSAAQSAAQAQADAAQGGITTVNDATPAGLAASQAGLTTMQAALAPYLQSGTSAVNAQSDLAGLNGPEAQAKAVAALSGGSEMNALVSQGEDALRQNATATGGLRGGNLQGALAQFRPQMLSNLINQQYTRLGSMAGLGGQAAGVYGQGAISVGGQKAGLYGQQGSSIAELLAAQGNAQAAGDIAQGNMWNAIPNAITTGLGTYTGLGGKF